MKLQCKARDLHDAIDAAWSRECPECGGTQLSEDGMRCWDCSAGDYLEEPQPSLKPEGGDSNGADKTSPLRWMR